MQLFQQPSDRYGYYTVGNEKIYSKFEAVKRHQSTGQFPHWYFHDDVFASYDWSHEPEASLADLYRARAQQLREKYDYVVICFSGGADSTNMLHAFLDNGIHVDEVVTWHTFEGNHNSSTHTDQEIARVTLPYMQKLQDAHPEIKFRVIDMTRPIYEFFQDTDNIDDTINQLALPSPNSMAWTRPFMLDRFYLDYIHSGKKIGFVLGMEKPRVWQVDGRWCVRFLDVSNVFYIGSSAPTEMFYWSPDLPPMLIKQAHIIKRYLEHATAQTPWVQPESSGLACVDRNGQTLWLHRDGVSSLIYPTWDINTFQVEKTPSPIFVPNTTWLYDNEIDSTAKNYRNSILHFRDSIPEYWRNDNGAVFRGLRGTWSRPYYLDKQVVAVPN